MAGIPLYSKELRVVNTIEGRYDKAADATGKIIGTLPKGALVLPSSYAFVATGFDGTAPTFQVGFAGATAAIMASADVAPAAQGIKAAVAATMTTGGLNAPLSADKDVVLTVSEPGDGTVGTIYVVIDFIIPFSVYGNITG